MYLRILTSGLLGLLWVGLSCLQAMVAYSPFEDLALSGLDAFHDKKYDKAYTIYKKISDQGSAAGAAGLGDLYFAGLGVKQDYAKAKFYYELARAHFKQEEKENKLGVPVGNIDDLGFLHASFRLARMATLGLGIPKDFKKAFELYEDVLWFAECLQDDLGCLRHKYSEAEYYKNYGYEQLGRDYGSDGFKFNAAGDFADAFYNLGKAYQEGLGVAKDPKRALSCIQKATMLRSPEALKQIHTLLSLGKQAQTHQDYQRAYGFYKQADSMGSIEGAIYLGDLYFAGLGVPKDYKQAYFYYQSGFVRFWTSGYTWGDVRDEKLAMYVWGERSRSVFYASFQLARMTDQGLGVPKESKKAFELYQRLLLYAKQCNLYTNDHLQIEMPGGGYDWSCAPRNLYADGFDYKQSKLLHMDIEKIGQVLYFVGRAYLEGLGTAKDVRQALAYLKKAMEFGNEEAIGVLKNQK